MTMNFSRCSRYVEARLRRLGSGSLLGVAQQGRQMAGQSVQSDKNVLYITVHYANPYRYVLLGLPRTSGIVVHSPSTYKILTIIRAAQLQPLPVGAAQQARIDVHGRLLRFHSTRAVRQNRQSTGGQKQPLPIIYWKTARINFRSE